MLKKATIAAVLLLTLLVFAPAYAAVDNTSQLPETNPFCWHRSDCQKIRKNYGGTGTGDEGFITDASVAPCTGGVKGSPEEWGRCLPVGTSKTEISFGGQSQFSDIGSFILLMYKYLLGVASIVAAAMIMIAGVQWVTSGGNSEAIGSAKKRIGGAVIGLFIGYMSFFILNTINPALVNLRLPQVWLIRPQSFTPEYCGDIQGADSSTVKFMFAAPATSQTNPVTPATATGASDKFKWTNPKTEPQFACGSRFFAENGGDVPCRGSICAPDSDGNQKTCFSADGQNYSCGDVRLAGRISYSSIVKNCSFSEGAISNLAGTFGGPWDCPPTDKLQLMVVCKNPQKLLDTLSTALQSKADAFSKYDFGKGTTAADGRYSVTSKSSDVLNEAMHRCDDLGNGTGADAVKGFVADFLMVKNSWVVSNKSHLIGKGGVDLGWWQNVAFEMYKVDPKYLFSADDILKGTHLDVDAADIEDATTLTDKNKSYWESQYQQ